ncbi:MAG: PAS domain S-box protein [Nitrospirota bacterium]
MDEILKELLKAIDKIGEGDFSYRIQVDGNDEFQIIAGRFNDLIAQLQTSDKRLKSKLSETELMLDISQTAERAVDLQEALQTIVETIVDRMAKDACAINLYNHNARGFCIEAIKGDLYDILERCIPPDKGIAQKILKSLAPLIIHDLEKEPEGLLISRKSGSLAVFPIFSDSNCIGFLVLFSKKIMAFTEDDVKTLHILTNTIGYVIKNARLYETTKNQLQRLSALYELSNVITNILDLNELLKRITEEVTRLLNARGCVLRLLEDDHRLIVRSAFGLPEGIEGRAELALGEGLAGWVAKNDMPLLVEDISKMPENLTVQVTDVKSAICVPLKVRENIIGTLCFYDKRGPDDTFISFDIDDLGIVEGFASISALAIDKAWIYEKELQREKEAIEAKKRMEILFESVQGGIVTLGRDYKVRSVNRFVEHWTGRKVEDIIGKDCIEVFHQNGGICPHCVAKATFETGEINSIAQLKDANYAELTSYPIRDEKGNVVETVVFIQDITDRVLHQEEILSLYKEVSETKDYLESLIENSADAIVTTDLNGIVTSWNKGAERIYGFTEQETIGKFLPNIPESIIDVEKEYIERIKRGETIKRIDTIRKKKDGTIFEVSVTLSPIRDSTGEVIGISSISRDISERKRVEKELIKRNEELSRLFFISSAMRGTLELDRLLRMVLTAVTMGDGLGFNRAILFLVDESKGVLKGAMGVGPASHEEAFQVWERLSSERKTLSDIIHDIEIGPLSLSKDSFLNRLSLSVEIPLTEETILTKAIKEKRTFNIQNAFEEPLTDAFLLHQLYTHAYAVIPLISRDKVIGAIWVDNHFSRKPIVEEDMRFLNAFSNQVSTAIESARLFEQVTLAEQELENIFESISDMVCFNDKDYVIRNINKAVSEKIGKLPEEIIGKKCHEIFHGMNEPWPKCPHHKTVLTKKAFIEEIEDPHLEGTFITSSSPIFDSMGEFIGTVHVIRDITELKILREKLVRAEKMAALGEVAAKVAHEIRNPLTSIGGFARRLTKKLEGNLKDYAEIIANEVVRLENTLNEILSFIKEVRIEKEMANINRVVDDVTSLIKPELDEKEIVLVKDLGDTPDVHMDPNSIKEALLNILRNAIHAIGVTGTIYVKTYLREDSIAVEVKDTGKGIPEKILPYIFDPFFTTKDTGTGLGLTITQKIIEKHNGRIEIESRVEKGSTFRFFIPLRNPEK